MAKGGCRGRGILQERVKVALVMRESELEREREGGI